MNFFIVNLEVRAANEELGTNLGVPIDITENMLETPRNNSGHVLSAEHCVGLTATSLTICKYGSVISLNY